MRKALLAVATLVLAFPAARAAKPAPDHWVGTWAASPFDQPNKEGALAGDTTLRQVVHVSLGGSLVRVQLSNEFGTDPLTISGAHIALSAGDAAIQLTTANALTFNGAASVTIPPGAFVVSDPAGLKLPAMSDVAVTLQMPAQPLHTWTYHASAFGTNYIAPGAQLTARDLTDAKPFKSWRILKGVDVMAPAEAGSIVCFGDSITDGAKSTDGTNSRWPDVLAKRLLAEKKTAQLGILNQGIGGNRLLHDKTGPSALARFDRDVVAQTGVKYVVILEGINDIGHAADPVKPYDVIGADDLKFALTQMIERAHEHGIKVIGATLTPYTGAKYMSPAGEAMRTAENDFIRHSGKFDGVIDFDQMTRDPGNAAVFNPAFDSGDHLHPKDAGYKAMGSGIDLKVFEQK